MKSKSTVSFTQKLNIGVDNLLYSEYAHVSGYTDNMYIYQAM